MFWMLGIIISIYLHRFRLRGLRGWLWSPQYYTSVWERASSITSNNDLLKSIGLLFYPADQGACCGRQFTCTWCQLMRVNHNGNSDLLTRAQLPTSRPRAWGPRYSLCIYPLHCLRSVHVPSKTPSTNCTRISQRRSMSNLRLVEHTATLTAHALSQSHGVHQSGSSQ